MMTSSAAVLALILLLAAMVLGLSRALLGPTLADRMLSVLLLGTCGVAIVLLLGFVLAAPALIDVALVMALLAAVAVVALTQEVIGDD
ncbi:monovalent cation/H+ antiporter complex subunit F [Marinobacterium jannaschii]|uniref:monovalent cation/H+ antiporter complex subunit F n=1 Tax=Marinobacterium jannaschii TaxID=64970 RepID=UPI0006872657|nr:monovalent cation/H+ antiporter complex subunit F [Marinobacterium jannaschii]